MMIENRVELQFGGMRVNDILGLPDVLNKLYNIKGCHVNIECKGVSTASYITTILVNTNIVTIVNGIVIKSFDSTYIVGELVGWFKDYKVIKFN